MALAESHGGIDYPDGGFTGGVGLYSLIGDLAELAARLDSPVTFNREGCVVFMDSFEYGLSMWSSNAVGTGGEVIISAARARSGGYSCKLVAGSDSYRTAELFTGIAAPQQVRYGIEVAFSIDDDIQDFSVQLINQSATILQQFAWMYVYADQEIQVRDNGGTWQTVLEDVDFDYTYWGFPQIKMVVDLLNSEYDRLIVSDQEIDISEYSASTSSGNIPAFIYVHIVARSDSGSNGIVYIDNVILTRNEPARRE